MKKKFITLALGAGLVAGFMSSSALAQVSDKALLQSLGVGQGHGTMSAGLMS